MIENITILGGHGKTGEPEPVERIDLQMGNVASIVGPTGSGKTTLINDIEMFAEHDTPSGRTHPDQRRARAREYRNDPSKQPHRPDHAAHDVPVRPAGRRVPRGARPGAVAAANTPRA